MDTLDTTSVLVNYRALAMELLDIGSKFPPHHPERRKANDLLLKLLEELKEKNLSEYGKILAKLCQDTSRRRFPQLAKILSGLSFNEFDTTQEHLLG